MDHSFAAVIIGGVLLAQILVVTAQSQQVTGPQTLVESESASAALSILPAAPRGKSTILGGEVQDIDRVRDEFRLKVYGQRPIKIIFDERTQVYLDGKRIPLRDLRSNDHGSVQTVLDGTDVFALSVHLLSRSPEGEYQGQVLNFNADTRALTVSAVLSPEPFTLLVPSDTPIARAGQMPLDSVQPRLADLIRGTLISLTFESDRKGGGVATRIVILASPGSAFLFDGDLSSIDMHSGILVLVDSRNEKSYEIAFDSALLPISRTLHVGDNVRVSATFNGSHYIANTIAAN
jgi:hypothetical protein